MPRAPQSPSALIPAPAAASRIDRRKGEFREKITRAALKLFARDGMANTSIAAIIQEADIAHKTFFNHFPTRDHLLQYLVSSHSEQAYGIFREGFGRYDDPRKRLEYCLNGIAKALAGFDAHHYKELVTFYFISGTSTEDFRRQQKENFTGLILQILRDAKEKKMLRAGFTPESLSEIVVGICISTLINWTVEENFAIVPKMKTALQFINQSIFIEA